MLWGGPQERPVEVSCCVQPPLGLSGSGQLLPSTRRAPVGRWAHHGGREKTLRWGLCAEGLGHAAVTAAWSPVRSRTTGTSGPVPSMAQSHSWSWGSWGVRPAWGGVPTHDSQAPLLLGSWPHTMGNMEGLPGQVTHGHRENHRM